MRELYVTGFRSGVFWKKLVASAYYIFIIYSCIHIWGMMLFFLALPFAIFSLSELIKVSQSAIVLDGNLIVFILSNIAMFIGGRSVYHSFFNKDIVDSKSLIDEQLIADKYEKDELLKVHFLGIGQGDCILIEQGRHAMLIDAGYRVNGKSIVKYLQRQHIDRFDYIIATHPHPDHVGGLAEVLKNFETDRIIMPCMEYTKNNYRDLVRLIEKKDIETISPVAGTCYEFGRAYFTILAPNSDGYARLNNYSIVTKLTFKRNSFLFTGDAEKLSEYEMLIKGFDLKADLLKIGHHGSSTSSSLQFLNAVSPKHAVISTGRHSFYAHPDKITLDNIDSIGAKIYRTDKSGNIVVLSDGKEMSIDTDSVPVGNDSFINRLNRRKVIMRIKERHRAIF